MVHQISESYLVVEVKSKQHLDPLLIKLKGSVLGNMNDSFSQGVIVSLGTKGYSVCLMLVI